MSTLPDTELPAIDLSMSWTVAAKVYTLVLRDGTAVGKDEAQRELIRMGRMMDVLCDAARQGTAKAYTDAILTLSKMNRED